MPRRIEENSASPGGQIATVVVYRALVVAPRGRLLNQSGDDAGDRFDHAPDIVRGARLAIELGRDNLEELIGEMGGAVGVNHVASEINCSRVFWRAPTRQSIKAAIVACRHSRRRTARSYRKCGMTSWANISWKLIA